MSAKKSTAIYKPGFVEAELQRYASAPHLNTADDYRHIMAMLAAAMLMLLERKP